MNLDETQEEIKRLTKSRQEILRETAEESEARRKRILELMDSPDWHYGFYKQETAREIQERKKK